MNRYQSSLFMDIPSNRNGNLAPGYMQSSHFLEQIEFRFKEFEPSSHGDLSGSLPAGSGIRDTSRRPWLNCADSRCDNLHFSNSQHVKNLLLAEFKEKLPWTERKESKMTSRFTRCRDGVGEEISWWGRGEKADGFSLKWKQGNNSPLNNL